MSGNDKKGVPCETVAYSTVGENFAKEVCEVCPAKGEFDEMLGACMVKSHCGLLRELVRGDVKGARVLFEEVGEYFCGDDGGKLPECDAVAGVLEQRRQVEKIIAKTIS
ncbi:MAG: hypothetical protein V1679_03040, partial [Candidatus Peregrinibacteria bacterium]